MIRVWQIAKRICNCKTHKMVKLKWININFFLDMKLRHEGHKSCTIDSSEIWKWYIVPDWNFHCTCSSLGEIAWHDIQIWFNFRPQWMWPWKNYEIISVENTVLTTFNVEAHRSLSRLESIGCSQLDAERDNDSWLLHVGSLTA